MQCEADRMALAALDHEFRLQEITQIANRGNVTFYPVFARGLVAFDAPIGPEKPPPVNVDMANLRTRQERLRFLATDTDGVAVINTNNIDGALSRIVDDLKSGLIDLAVAQHPAEIGYYGVMSAYAVINGQSVPPIIGTGATIMTKDNIDDPDVAKFVYSD